MYIIENSLDKHLCPQEPYCTGQEREAKAKHGHVPKIEGGLKEPFHLGTVDEVIDRINVHINRC